VIIRLERSNGLDVGARYAQDQHEVSHTRGIRTLGLLHPTFESWGGAEWFIHQTLSTLAAEAGIESVIYTHRWTPPPGEDPPYRVVCHRRGGVLSAPWDWQKIAGEQAPLWRRHDLLFIHNYPAALWYHSGGGRAALPPAVWYCHEPPATLHGDGDHRSRPSGADSLRSLLFHKGRSLWRLRSRLRERGEIRRRGFGGWLEDLKRREREAVEGIPSVLANSRFTASRVREIYSREATVIYPLPPDLGSLRPDGNSVKEREILCVGRLTPAKRPLLLPVAWRRALDAEERLRAYRLVYVGDGPLRPDLLALVRDLGLSSHVETLRNLSRFDLIARYRRALLSVHLGVGEPFGLVPLESMAAGTAVLAEGEGGVRETIEEGKSGWCVAGLDVPGLADWLGRVPSMHDRLVAMGQAASEHVQAGFRPPDAMSRLLDCFGAAVQGGASFRGSP
jgi:glycosyltransferase involved in cell wall biosynthesis